MKVFRVLVVLIGMAMLASSAADGMQLRGLVKKAKEKAEETVEEEVERKVEQETERQVEKLVDSMWDGAAEAVSQMLESAMPKAKTSVDLETGTLHRDGLPDLDLRDNEGGPANASFVSYLSVSTIKLTGELAGLTEMFGNATVEEVLLHEDRRLSSSEETGMLVEADPGRFVYMDHANEQYWANTYDEMMTMAEESMDRLQSRINDTPTPDADNASRQQMEADVSVRPGGRKTVRGLDAEQTIILIETVMEDQSQEEAQGKLWVVTELWTAAEFGGSQTLKEFEGRVGEGIMKAMGGSGLDAKMDMSAFGDPRIAEGMREVSQRLEEVDGLPVETNTYFVMTGAEDELDVEAVLSGQASSEAGGSQVVMFSATSFMANLSTDSFDTTRLDIPATYTEVESPLEAYLDASEAEN